MVRTAEEHLTYWLALDSPPTRFVYILQAEGDSPIKVGWAVDVRKRIAALQTGNPRLLRPLCVLVGEQRLEHNFHRRLGRNSRMVGEWFDGDEARHILGLAGDLADQMVAHHEATGKIPRWWEFLPDWQLHSGARTKPTDHIKIRRMDSAPRNSLQGRCRTPSGSLGLTPSQGSTGSP